MLEITSQLGYDPVKYTDPLKVKLKDRPPGINSWSPMLKIVSALLNQPARKVKAPERPYVLANNSNY